MNQRVFFVESGADQEESKKNIFQFQDLKTVPDEIKDYSPSLQNEHTPILIDNGE
jgi:hypothetical protein